MSMAALFLVIATDENILAHKSSREGAGKDDVMDKKEWDERCSKVQARVYMCVCVSVCVCERERERELKRSRKRSRIILWLGGFVALWLCGLVTVRPVIVWLGVCVVVNARPF
jgi:hypothetical protein